MVTTFTDIPLNPAVGVGKVMAGLETGWGWCWKTVFSFSVFSFCQRQSIKLNNESLCGCQPTLLRLTTPVHTKSSHKVTHSLSVFWGFHTHTHTCIWMWTHTETKKLLIVYPQLLLWHGTGSEQTVCGTANAETRLVSMKFLISIKEGVVVVTDALYIQRSGNQRQAIEELC